MKLWVVLLIVPNLFVLYFLLTLNPHLSLRNTIFTESTDSQDIDTISEETTSASNAGVVFIDKTG